MPRRQAKKKIVVSDINKQKRVDFCKLMLSKSEEELASIWFSDETIVKSHPNGEYVYYRLPEGSGYFEASNASSGKPVMFWSVISMELMDL